jgi:hypothetical protein
MAEPVSLQTLLTYLTLISVPVGVFYHIMTLRNTRRNQDLQLETRSLQLFMQLFQQMNSPENMKNYIEILNWEWDDYHDFEMKYGSDDNEEAWAKRISWWRRYNVIGLILRDKRIDTELLYDFIGTGVINLWKKYEPIIMEQRVRYGLTNIFQWFEYLADEMNRVRLNRGITEPLPDTFLKYIPDQ